METAIRTFFANPRFAVVGASSDTAKYGYKVFAWYLSHGLPVTGINPKTPTILEQQTVPGLDSLEAPSETSVSIITPPAITLKTVERAKELGIKVVWCQPGSENEEVLQFAKNNGITCIANGACVLVDGENGLKLAGRDWKL
ncbi:hypothetical protein H072_8865 [Dactylellina haptotyla CBS 200.50]|uniref:CoA-binding domain-containing protein n=1 Tax=Dactylellina haptotyla (strain CBS 200.50) TaxID=1284197 RepID=S8BDU7_DACHA|nr:hypothetical protein H072_8865 [Dactylellina haptotyla CBS 200.50]